MRALKVPFPGKSKGQIHPNYVLFINSQTHTNDANFEFHYLADMKDNIKILSRENILELIIEFDLLPETLKGKIGIYDSGTGTTNPIDIYGETIRDTILGGNNLEINKILDHDLKIETRVLSTEIKALIINYIFQKWSEDPSWAGTVKPMKWLRYYFDYIQPEQSSKLLKVIEEYVSSNPSFEAVADTAGVISKITPNQISAFEHKFIEIIVQETRNHAISKHPLLEVKYNEFIKSGFLSEAYIAVKNQMQTYLETKAAMQKTTDEEKKNSFVKH